MTNILNLKIGKLRRVLVKDIIQEKIKKEDLTLDKIVFKVIDPYTQKTFDISDAWVDTKEGVKIKGLWLSLQNGGIEIQKHSTLAKLLEFYNVKTLEDFLDKTIDAYPDNKNFLVLVACNLPEEL